MSARKINMPIVLDLPKEAEVGLQEKAAQNGLAPQDYVILLLLSDLPPLDSLLQKAGRLSRNESQLLTLINQGTATDVWERYDALVQKRDARTLTPEEQAELLVLSDRIEEENAERIGRVAELARLRGTTLPALLHTLGIGPRKASGDL